MMLLLKALRDLRTLGAGALLIAAIIATGAGVAVGINQALDDVGTTRDVFFSDYALADLDVQLTRPVPQAELMAAVANSVVTDSAARLIVGGTTDLAQGETVSTEVVGMSPRTTLNKLDTLAGTDLGSLGADEALLDADFAQYAGLSIGDPLRLTVAGGTATWRVAGLVRSPEFLLATANPDYLLPQKGSLAVIFVPLQRLQTLLGIPGRVNDLLVNLSAGLPVDSSAAFAESLPVARLIPRTEQYSLRFTQADVRIFATLAPVLGGTFSVAGLLLIMMSLFRIVDHQRRELGAMMAIGYRRISIVTSVVLVAALLGLLGAAGGIGVTVGVARLVSSQYSAAVGFPSVVHHLQQGSVLQCIAIALGASLLAAILPAVRVARLSPAVAMRGRAPGSAALPFWLESLTETWKTPWAYATRSVVRRPLLTLATVVSVGAAIGLGASLQIVAGSVDFAIDGAFANDSWTHMIDLATPMTQAEAASLALAAGIDRFEPILKGTARITSDSGADAGVQVVGTPPTSQLMALDVVAGAPPASGTIDLSEQTARTLAVRPGEKVNVVSTSGTARLTVSGQIRTLASSSAYVTIEEAGRLLNRPGQVTTVMVVTSPEQAATLRLDPAVARVASRAQIQDGARELVTELTLLIGVVLAISLAVGALFLVASLSLSYLDRSDEFATLRAMGYGRRPVATIVTIETVLQTAVAGLIAVPAGLLLATPLMARLGQAWFHISMHVTPLDYALLIPALLLSLIPAAIAVRRLMGLNISEAVRARLIG